jgi:glycine/D-amino acid oxidase-like deaminating enzyme
MFMRPFWFSQSIIKHVPRYAKLLGKEKKVDVAVVGAGITGLSTAIKLKEAGKTVAVIEGARVGQGVTGLTTGKVTSLHRLSFAQIASKMGDDKAKLYAEFNEDGIAIIEENIKKYNIECDFERRDNFTYTQDESMVTQILDEVKVAQQCGLKASFTENVELPYPIRGAIKLDNQAYFNAYAYCLGLANAFHGNGCAIYEDSRVKDVHGMNSPHRVETFEGEIEADFVVVAVCIQNDG